MNDIDRRILATGLKKLFQKESFSICDIDTLTAMAHVVIDQQDYARMRALHCVAYGAMDSQVKAWLFQAVMNAFAQPSTFDPALIDALVMGADPEKMKALGYVPQKQNILQRFFH